LFFLIVGLGLCATGAHGLVQGRSGDPIVPVIWICLGAVSLWLFVAAPPFEEVDLASSFTEFGVLAGL